MNSYSERRESTGVVRVGCRAALLIHRPSYGIERGKEGGIDDLLCLRIQSVEMLMHCRLFGSQLRTWLKLPAYVPSAFGQTTWWGKATYFKTLGTFITDILSRIRAEAK